MKRVEIKALFAEPERYTAEPVTICGWVRTLRDPARPLASSS